MAGDEHTSPIPPKLHRTADNGLIVVVVVVVVVVEVVVVLVLVVVVVPIQLEQFGNKKKIFATGVPGVPTDMIL
jgi:hypothetical protein